MASIRMPSPSFILSSVLAALVAAFLLKVYQERSRAIGLRKQRFVSGFNFFPGKETERRNRQCRLIIPYSAIY